MKKLLIGMMVPLALGGQSLRESPQAESARKNQELVLQGYNLTHGFNLGTAEKPAQPAPFEFLVPASQKPHQIFFWLAAEEGEAGVRLRSKNGQDVFAWSGNRGELTLSRNLPAGRYALEFELSGGKGGKALLGLRGGLVAVCAVEPGRMEEVPPAADGSRHWPYLLYRPPGLRRRVMLVVPNNTGFPVEDLELLRASGTCEVERQRALADRLGCPLLVPLFPRPAVDKGNLYLHSLTREALETRRPGCVRVDLQLLAMIQDARKRLAGAGWDVGPRVLMAGFSASGAFVNRFAILHPEAVLAAACGAPGFPTVPASACGGERLTYPVGIADLEALTGRPPDWKALKEVSWFFYHGEKDANDPVRFRDAYSKADEALVLRRFGNSNQDRWKPAEALFRARGLNALFRAYPGAGHESTREMREDVARFLEAAAPRR